MKFKKKFAHAVALQEIRARRELQKMVLLQKGSRLSIQPVTEKEFNIIREMGSKKPKSTGGSKG